MTIAYFLLALLNVVSETIELTYDLGRFTRTHILPALVYTYVFTERYIVPAFYIPKNYMLVRSLRLSGVG